MASFVGETNLLPGKVVMVADGKAKVETSIGTFVGSNPRQMAEGAAASLFVRPEALRPAAGGIEAYVGSVAYEGNLTHVRLTAGGKPLIMLLGAGDGVAPPVEGETIHLGITHMTGLYILVFFTYLFGPLAVMGVTAFNRSSYPQAYPFEGFTLNWFSVMANDKDVIYGLQKSAEIGVFVVLLSVPLGLAGALVMQQINRRARGLYYLVVVSPVLTPGVIIGISTVIFWRDFTAGTGMRFLYDGTILTVLGQSSFIAAYCMLIILARLQRFDRGLEEAALDLGASHTQVFFHVLLPFLRPAMLSAGVLAFLSSFENYNTTTFSILADKTLTTVLAGRVRQGTSPALSALAVSIIAVTVVGAIVYEMIKRREDTRRAAGLLAAARLDTEEPVTA